MVKNLPANAGRVGDMGSILGLGRSPGEGNSIHFCILASEIPWTEESGSCKGVRHNLLAKNKNEIFALFFTLFKNLCTVFIVSVSIHIFYDFRIQNWV